jgi:hypothetical protein
MVAVPPLAPVAMPLDEPMLAMPGALLLHVPPALELVKVEVAPWQKV